MKRLHIHRPIFSERERCAMDDSGTRRSYSERMVQHLQDCEDWQRTMRDADTEGWGVANVWVLMHSDGRIARLPDRCPYEKMRKSAERREAAWMRYWKRKYGLTMEDVAVC